MTQTVNGTLAMLQEPTQTLTAHVPSLAHPRSSGITGIIMVLSLC